jgi:RNA polymerase sigma-70 factor (ECF subfamily)
MTQPEAAREMRARFEALAHGVTVPLHRYLLRRADADAVDDILAETLLVLWRRIEDVPGLTAGPVADPDAVLPWCYGVARGCLANARRAERRRLSLVERLTRTAQRPQMVVTDHSDLQAALDRLNELDREVLLLWAWEGLAPRQIAEVSGLTANAVSIRLHRAKKKLAVMLGRKDGLPAGHETGEGRSNR